MTPLETRPATAVSTLRRPIRTLVELWAAGTGIAVVLTAAAYLMATATTGQLTVTGAGEVTLGNVVGFTTLGGTVGAALAYAAGRFARRPRLTFLAVTLIALAGYAVVPFAAAETTRTAIWLNVFHVLAAIPVIGMLVRFVPRDSASFEA